MTSAASDSTAINKFLTAAIFAEVADVPRSRISGTGGYTAAEKGPKKGLNIRNLPYGGVSYGGSVL